MLADIEHISGILKRAIQARNDFNCHVEIVTNLIPGVNDSIEDIKGIAEWIASSMGPETPWHITRFYPHYRWSDRPPTTIDGLERAREIGRNAGLYYVYIGNVFGHEGENTYCPRCGALLIKRNVFDILRNRLKDGCCPDCNYRIEGKFS